MVKLLALVAAARQGALPAITLGRPKNKRGVLMASMPTISDDPDRVAKLHADFIAAAECGYTGTCRQIVAELGPSDVVAVGGRTMLMVAADHGQLDLCELLLERGAQIDDEDDEGRTALFFGARHADVVSLLLDHGVDVNIEWRYSEDGEVRTALDRIAKDGHVGSCRIVVTRASNVDSDAKVRAMVLAAKEGHAGVIDFFLGVDRELVASSMSKLLLGAAEVGAVGMCQQLVERGAARDSSDALIRAAHHGRETVCHYFASGGADLNAVNSDGYTALHAAAASGSVSLAAWLIAQGADVNVSRPGLDWTPICALAQHGYSNVIVIARMFVAAGAEASTPSARLNGLTPLQHCVSGGRTNLVEFFLDELGEDVCQRTADGRALTELVSTATSSGRTMEQMLRARVSGRLVELAIPTSVAEPTASARSSASLSL